MRRCKTCDTWIYNSERIPHKCLPVWLVWSPENHEDEDDASTVYACDAEDAAEAWAERHDEDGADIAHDGETYTVSVREVGDGTVSIWRVSGEVVASYRADQVLP